MLIVLLPLATWMGVLAWDASNQKQGITAQINTLKAKISSLENENSKLEKLKEFFNNPAFLERQAREKLNFKSPDEQVVFVYKNEGTASVSAEGVGSQSWYAKIWNKVRGLVKSSE